MKPIPSLRDLKAIDDRQQRLVFAEVARTMLIADGSSAADWAMQLDVPAATRRVLKAAIAAGTLNDPANAGLAEYRQAMAAFNATLSQVGIFDWMLASMQAGELHTRFGALISHLAAAAVAEGAAKPVTRGTFAPSTLQPRKAAGLVVLSKELLRHGRGVDIVETALRTAVVRSTDNIFLQGVSADASLGTATGIDSAGVLEDLRRALDVLPLGTESRPHVVLASSICRRLALMPSALGTRAFPELDINGGSLAGLPVRASDQAIDDVTIIDATGYVAAGDQLDLRSSEQASIEMDTAPSSASSAGSPAAPSATTQVHLWQSGARALLAERTFGFDRLRTAAVKLESVQWGLTGSPPS